MAYANIAVVVLGAGQARRFGSDKLMVDLNGAPLGLHIGELLATMDFATRFLVCSKGAALVQHYRPLGFEIIENEAAEMGQAHSLHLAVNAALNTKADALLVTLADMPFIERQHLEALLETQDFAASFDGTKPMPPVIFPRQVWPQLLAISGDQGARAMLMQARMVQASARILRDIDTPADLSASN